MVSLFVFDFNSVMIEYSSSIFHNSIMIILKYRECLCNKEVRSRLNHVVDC